MEAKAEAIGVEAEAVAASASLLVGCDSEMRTANLK